MPELLPDGINLSPQAEGRLSVAEGRLFLSTSSGCLEVLELAPAGRRAMPVKAWLQGVRLEKGECFSNLN